MTRRLVVLDVDSTLIENEVIELLADAAGSRALVAEVTERAMRGEIDFAESLRERVSTLAGIPESTFASVVGQVEVTNGVPDLIAAVHAAGGKVGVVSGGFHEILDPLAERLGLDYWKANRLEVVEGHLTGRVLGQIVDAQAKADWLALWARQEEIPLEQTVAIGDGANDLKMMAIAGVSIAFDAKPVVAEQADFSITSRDMREAIGIIGL
jgi:phosphoserine phosphatase